MQDKPHIFEERGNALFIHVPKSFTNEEIENWANKERPLGDAQWRLAPITERNPENRVACSSNGASWHVALTIEGKEFRNGNADSPQANLDEIGAMIASMQKAGAKVKRPKQPIVRANTGEFGYDQLFAIKPELSIKFKAYLQELMRGPSDIPVWERESLLANLSIMDSGTWCVAVHRETAITLIGGLDKYTEACLTPKSTALGALAVAMSSGVYIPDLMINKVKEQGWTDSAIHDVAHIVGVSKFLNVYTESLAASLPNTPDDPIITAAGKKLAAEGYI